MDQEEMEALALRFLAVESISGNETAYGELVAEVLKDLGHSVEFQEVAPRRRNIAADAHGKRVLFCTHLDTVPPYFPPHIDDTHIHGRGACDTKGILSAMIAAGQRLRFMGIDDFGYLLVVGEEVDGIGAQTANERYRCDYVIVGEPTENRLATAHKGVLKFRLVASGQAGHSAYPETGHSAIHELLGALDGVRAIDFGSDPELGDATLNIGRVEGGRAANVIADTASAEGMIRLVGAVEPAVEALHSSVGESVSLEIISAKPPSRMRSLEGFELCVVNFATDIPYLGAVGTPLLYGPGSILDAHTAQERVARLSLGQAVDDYVRMVQALLAL